MPFNTQLCSVCGWSIFYAAAAILSAAEYLCCPGVPDFLLSLDFFHAYGRVSMQWLDHVLEAMGFGIVLCHSLIQAPMPGAGSESGVLHTPGGPGLFCFIYHLH
jgi:hypothetical protein